LVRGRLAHLRCAPPQHLTVGHPQHLTVGLRDALERPRARP
jgi:hypothetical protein